MHALILRATSRLRSAAESSFWVWRRASPWPSWAGMRAGSAALLATCLLARPASAAPAPGPRPSRRSLEEVAVMLSSNDENELRTALEATALLPAREVVPMLEERVHAGLTRVLLDVAIDSLLLLGDRAAAPLLVELSSHRRPEVRVRAIEALTRLKYPQGERALSRALGDVSPEVRKAAAEGLGELGLHASASGLMRAFELGVDGSARALGRVANNEDVPRLLTYMERVSLSTLSPMFAALLARRDVSEAAKLQCVDKLASLETDEARAELSALLAELPREASARLRRALTEGAQPSAGAKAAHKGASE